MSTEFRVSEWRKRANARREHHVKNIKSLSVVLHAMGITSAELHYEGAGDSGSFGSVVLVTKDEGEDVRWQTVNGGFTEGDQDPLDGDLEPFAWPVGQVAMWVYDYGTKGFVSKMRELEDALNMVMEQSIELYHGGWCDNEGGKGCSTLDTEAGAIDLHHGSFYQEVGWTDSSQGRPPVEPEEVPAEEDQIEEVQIAGTSLGEGEE